jgi:hypothetical protein
VTQEQGAELIALVATSNQHMEALLTRTAGLELAVQWCFLTVCCVAFCSVFLAVVQGLKR